MAIFAANTGITNCNQVAAEGSEVVVGYSVVTQMKLSQKFCNSPNLQAKYYWDDALPCFGLRVYLGGKRSFVLYSRLPDGKKIYKTLGDPTTLSLADARALAIKTKAQCAATNDTHCIAGCCNLYLTRYAKQHKRTWKEDEHYIKNYIVPKFGNTKLENLSKHDIIKYHASITGHYSANKMIKILSRIYSYMTEIGIYAGVNPCIGIKKYNEQSRDRYLTKDELSRLLMALDNNADKPQCIAIKLLLYTGCRRSEILSLQWQNVNIDRAEIYLQRTKNGKQRTVPLIAEALEAIKQLPRISEWCFPSPSGTGHMHEMRRTWRNTCNAANITNLRLHDLRRTVGSLLVQDGVSLPIIASILGHSNTYVTHIYARLSATVERQALERFAEIVKNKD